MKTALINNNGVYLPTSISESHVEIKLKLPKISFSKFIPSKIKNTAKSFWMVATYSL